MTSRLEVIATMLITVSRDKELLVMLFGPEVCFKQFQTSYIVSLQGATRHRKYLKSEIAHIKLTFSYNTGSATHSAGLG